MSWPVRIFAISDIHVDYAVNLRWLVEISRTEYLDDILIVAGDLTDNVALLEESLQLLLARFHKVCFIPGNHELWLQEDTYQCSLTKFHAVKDLCRKSGVIVDCFTSGDVTLVPLFSWYDYSFAKPDSYLRRAWRDYQHCRWPAHLSDEVAVNSHFLEMNLPLLRDFSGIVISYSHFLPRIDLMPEQIPIARRRVYPVLGSESLGDQVSLLKPDIHIYGHSHVNRSVVISGTRYINNAFGNPRESRISRKQLLCVFSDSPTDADTMTRSRSLA